MLRQRILSALIGVPVVVAATWFGHPWYAILIAGIALWGLVEFYGLASRSQQRPALVLGVILTLLFLAYGLFKWDSGALLVSSAIVISLVWFLFRPPLEDAFMNWVWTLIGALYVGWLMSYFLLLRDVPQGMEWVLVALFTTFVADSAAYLVGRTLGRHSLAPRISPKKTWEGLIAGLLGAIVAAVVLISLFQLPAGWEKAGLLGLMAGVFGQFGDLSESMLKRSLKIKDSAQTIPGHGGILDRLDSLLFTVFVVYYYVVWIIG